MIRLTVDVAATDTARRLIEGTAVPYGELAEIGFSTYRFAPGSIKRARNATPLLLGHDANQPVGIVSELVDGEQGARVIARVDRTAGGDEALEQARSGSRSGLSIGFELEPDGFTERDGVVDVTAAALYEVSLVAIPAFTGASVDRVAAEHGAGAGTDDVPQDWESGAGAADEPNPDQIELGDEPDDTEENAGDGDDEGGTMSEETPAGTAGIDRPAMLFAERKRPRELNAGEFVRALIGAGYGDREAKALIQAALVESISTDVSGLLPPQYERTVIGERDVDRPLYTAFRGRPLPGVGLNVIKPKWGTHTAGAEAATVDADATSTKVTLTTQTATVKRWDWAGAIPWVVVQRSDPSVIDEIYADAVQGFYLYVEGKIGGQLLAAATGTSTTIGAALAEFYIATGNQRTAEVIVMAPDVWGKFADKSALSSSIVVGPVSGDGGFSASLAGIPVVVSGTITAAHTILATRRAVDARVTEPVRLTANAIGALNVELACVGEGLFDTDYPGELLQFATLLPAVAETSGKAK